MKKLFGAVCFCMLLLAGCADLSAETVPNYYTVRFVVKGNVCSEQTVEEGYLPRSVTPNIQGLKFVRWLDEQGEPVNPYTTFIYQDTRYEAEAYPELNRHVPYLFTDENYYLRPDDALSADELVMALQALAEEEAQQYFPGMPMGSQPMTVGTVSQVLESFYPKEKVAVAFSGQPQEKLTRAAFAKGMYQLLERSESETLSMDKNVLLPMDLTRDRSDAVILLEACMLHTPGTGEHIWSQLILPDEEMNRFENRDGWLYYQLADGSYLQSGYTGSLYFDQDGRYTSGDAELDQLVADTLKTLIEQDPNADRPTLLRAAFDHCAENCEYVRREYYTFGQTGWEAEDAKIMLETGEGNCYNFAAAFWALARGLGFEAQAVSGTCAENNQPHSWCFITFGDRQYIFDPLWQHTYRLNGNHDMDMFMIPAEKAEQWNYQWQ